MTITEKVVNNVIVDNVTVLVLQGDFTHGDWDLHEKIAELRRQSRNKIVLDMTDVPYVDETGLGEIVRNWDMLRKEGGALKLFGVSKRFRDKLDISKLTTVLEIYDNEKMAVASF